MTSSLVNIKEQAQPRPIPVTTSRVVVLQERAPAALPIKGINAAVANADGRSPLKYFLGSLFFGPLVTMLLGATTEAAGGRLRQVDLWKGRAKQG